MATKTATYHRAKLHRALSIDDDDEMGKLDISDEKDIGETIRVSAGFKPENILITGDKEPEEEKVKLHVRSDQKDRVEEFTKEIEELSREVEESLLDSPKIDSAILEEIIGPCSTKFLFTGGTMTFRAYLSRFTIANKITAFRYLMTQSEGLRLLKVYHDKIPDGCGKSSEKKALIKRLGLTKSRKRPHTIRDKRIMQKIDSIGLRIIHIRVTDSTGKNQYFKSPWNAAYAHKPYPEWKITDISLGSAGVVGPKSEQMVWVDVNCIP